ncbi:hypothetical protein PHMEG_0003916 [Phytophthora megakarya]|uniref:Uncharacterized protein n=1 Tax=Phytophthora megakarya TaxID=4795 RepID=A0A225WV12_9STRA|nr:hypothetical protein PHMEG_0003916 [Phytophthora megakarya]
MAPLVNAQTEDHSAQTEDHSAATHLAFLHEMLLRDYSKAVEDCLFIRLANLLSFPLVGSASHRLNLAVQNVFREVSDDLDKVKALMAKLKSLSQSAKLSAIGISREEQPRLPDREKETDQATAIPLWAKPTFSMVHRYFCLLEFIKDDDELADYLPGPTANRRLRKVLEDLSKVESVSKELQSSSVSLLDARVYFDGLLESLPVLSSHIGARAAIVHSPHFEACWGDLTRAEKASLSRIAIQRDDPRAAEDGTAEDADSSFVDLAKATVGTQRQALNPITLEIL